MSNVYVTIGVTMVKDTCYSHPKRVYMVEAMAQAAVYQYNQALRKWKGKHDAIMEGIDLDCLDYESDLYKHHSSVTGKWYRSKYAVDALKKQREFSDSEEGKKLSSIITEGEQKYVTVPVSWAVPSPDMCFTDLDDAYFERIRRRSAFIKSKVAATLDSLPTDVSPSITKLLPGDMIEELHRIGLGLEAKGRHDIVHDIDYIFTKYHMPLTDIWPQANRIFLNTEDGHGFKIAINATGIGRNVKEFNIPARFSGAFATPVHDTDGFILLTDRIPTGYAPIGDPLATNKGEE